MNSQKKYRKTDTELDRIVRAELNYRAGGKSGKKDIARTSEYIEARNRQIVEAHQHQRTAEILPAMLSCALQLKKGGSHCFGPDDLPAEMLQDYTNRKERFNTLFTAAIMALDDPVLREIVMGKQRSFEIYHERLDVLLALTRRVTKLQTEAGMISTESSGDEKKVTECLAELAPLRTELQNISAQCIEYQEDDYLEEAVQQLQQAVQSASRTVTEKGRSASRVLFETAGSIFHSYQSTPAIIQNMDRFLGQKEGLNRYLNLFETLNDTERRDQVKGFMDTVDGTIERLRYEVQKQKEHEARASEKLQQDVQETYEQFTEIREMYARGELTAESQMKNTGEKLKKYRDKLTANGQRILALEVERFINATGIGKPQTKLNADDPFNYKKGFYILLPITIILLVMVLALLVL